MSRGKRVFWSAVVIAVVVAAVTAFASFGNRKGQPGQARQGGGPAAGPAGDVREVRVARAELGTIRSYRELAATVEPTRLARLASPAEGPVARVLLREGDPVKSGQLLVVIGRKRATEARLSSDREELRKAQDELARVERLVAKGALPGEQLDRARAELERARAAVETSAQSASDFLVRAPWSGILSKVMVQEGNYVAPRAPLVEMFDPASLVLRLSLPEAIALKVQRGAPARVRFDAFAERELAGRLTRLYPELDRRLRTRIAELDVADVPSLAPGMFARVHLEVEVAHEAVLVPAAAVVITAGQERAAFVVSGDVARLRKIALGLEEGQRVQILSGVAAGELVVVGGQQRLRDGAAVKIKTEASSERAARGAPGSSGAKARAPQSGDR